MSGGVLLLLLPATMRLPAVPISAATSPPQHERTLVRYGTGFFVDQLGDVVTAAHVVLGCDTVSLSGFHITAERVPVIARDTAADIALIATGLPNTQPVMWSTTLPRRGDAVLAYSRATRSGDFPLSTPRFGKILDPNSTIDGRSLIVADLTVAEGDSGSPLFSLRGTFLGIIIGHLVGFGNRAAAVPFGKIRSFLSKSMIGTPLLGRKFPPKGLSASLVFVHCVIETKDLPL